jgi:hypothetical protein
VTALNRLFSDAIELWGEVLRRLLELPAVGVALVLTLIVSIGFGLLMLARKEERSALGRAWLASMLGVGALSFSLLIEQKLVRLQQEVRELDANTRVARLPRAPGSPAQRIAPMLFHPDQLRRALARDFGAVVISAQNLNPAMDYAVLQIEAPAPAMVFVTVVDLTHPLVEIEITERRGPKRQTSEFAREKDCAVAINGEAGVTPMPNAALGPWTGNWIVRGEPLLLEDSAARPFLSFDASNRAHYSVASTVDRSVTPEKYNTLWGRFDLLVGGAIVPHQKKRNVIRAPRTAMATDGAGHTLFLMVVDGRQQGYSHGLDLMDAAKILRAFGASEGMACDEGGSSAMYLKARDGLVNRPSAGFERPVYTHFGVRLRSEP